MKHGLTALLLAGALASLPGCITDPVTGESTLGVPISDGEESAMGVQYKPVIVQQYGGAYPDAELSDHLGRIVLGMTRRSVRPDLPWDFTVLNSSVPNAFAVPGGKVFVTRGLLAEMEDEAEFAVVMGHEIGHVEHRHAARSRGQSMLLQGVAGLGAAVLDNDLAGSALGTAAGLFSMRYSRDAERESDVRGVRNSYEAGYDPREGADVFRTFLRLKGGSEGGFLDSWTSSHPLDSERIASVKRLSAEIDPRLSGDAPVPGLIVTTPRWQQLVGRLKSEHKIYKAHDAALKQASEAGKGNALQRMIPKFEAFARQLPGHATFEQTLGLVLHETGDTEGARSHLERAAAMNQGLVGPEYYLAQIAVEQSRWDTAVQRSDRGLAILPGNYLCLFTRAEGHWGGGRRGRAEADYKAVLGAAPQKSRERTVAAQRLGVSATSRAESEPEPQAKPVRARRKGRRRR